MGNNIDDLEDNLSLQLEMINQTEAWWSVIISKKIARYQFLTTKLQQTFDQSLIPEIETLEKEIKHLKDKMNWEQAEIKSFEKRQDNLEKLKSRLLMSELSLKLSKKLAARKPKAS